MVTNTEIVEANPMVKCKKLCESAVKQLCPETESYFINTMLLNMAILNIGKSYVDITDDYSRGSEDYIPDETSQIVLGIVTDTKIDCLTSFTKLVIDSISETNTILNLSEEGNIIQSEFVSDITYEESDSLRLVFDISTLELKVYIDELRISPYILGEMYIRYTSNVKKCKEAYGFIGYAPSSELLAGVDFDSVYNYLISSGHFTDEELYFNDDENINITLQPYCTVLGMDGVKPYNRPIGVLMENTEKKSVKTERFYFIPFVMSCSPEVIAEQHNITFKDIGIRLFAPCPNKEPKIFITNPHILSVCTTQPKVITELQLKMDFTLKEVVDLLSKDKDINSKVILLDNFKDNLTLSSLKSMLGV